MFIKKTLTLEEVNLKMDGDTGTFEGYASKWNGVDTYGDTIVKGAFAETLRTNGQPKLFLEHSWKLGGAMLPIGKATCQEDDIGLYVRGELTPGLSIAGDVSAAMKHGTIDGLSIGGMVKRGDYEAVNGGRVIKKWHNLLDVSVVAYPADGAARIDLTSVKSAELDTEIAQIETLRDFEYFLRDASGFSKGAAQALTARVKSLFNSRDAEEQDETKRMSEILERIQKII